MNGVPAALGNTGVLVIIMVSILKREDYYVRSNEKGVDVFSGSFL